MTRTLLTLVALIASLLVAPFAAADPVNAVAGDASWYVLRAGNPANATEQERIQTHLEWVEGELRRADTSSLSTDAARRRAELLDTLASYRRAGEFPQHELAGDGRRPRWVDENGRACAVGHLVAASGNAELFERVAAEHEYDYVPEMRVPELRTWATTHGFTALELAMIQPTYDWGSVDMPDPIEERRRREALEQMRRIPRPLKPSEVDSWLSSSVNDRDVKRECLGRQTGAWKVDSTATIDGKVRAQIEVRVYREGADEALPEVGNCFEKQLLATMKVALERVNYTVEEAFMRSDTTRLRIPEGDAIERAFLARDAYVSHHKTTPESALAKCISESPVGEAPLTVPLKVSSWNGQVTVRWPEMQRTDEREHRELGWCVQRVLQYGRSETYGIWDHEFSVEIGADGSMRVKR